MSRTAFTPGPWALEPSARGGDLIVTQARDHDEPYLIRCPGSGGAMSFSETVCTMNWSGTDEWDANAHLIAAAPALYEALTALHARCIVHRIGLTDRDDVAPMKQAFAALAKARGEA